MKSPEPTWASYGRSRLTFVLLAALIAIPLASSPAAAYPSDANNCNDRTLVYNFSNSGDISWSNTRRNWSREALTTLEEAIDAGGNSLLEITEDATTSDSIDFRIDDAPPGIDGGFTRGAAECNWFNASIWINGNMTSSNSLNNKARWQKVSQHEMGHLAGMEHSGNQDSLDALIPVMKTCGASSSFDTFNGTTLAKDTTAYLNYLHNPSGSRQFNANIGFEQGQRFWQTKNTTALLRQSGGVGGPQNLSVRGNKYLYNSYIFQGFRVWHGDETPKYKAEGDVRESLSSNTTQVRTRMFMKKMIENSDPNPCNYPLGLDNINFTNSGDPAPWGWVVTNQTNVVNLNGTAWQSAPLDTGTWTNPIDASPHLAYARGFNIQVRYYTKATTTAGENGYTYFDNLEVKGSH